MVAAGLVWHVSIPPSNDRQWRLEVANPPRALVDGYRVRFTNYRHFVYRSRDDFDVRDEDVFLYRPDAFSLQRDRGGTAFLVGGDHVDFIKSGFDRTGRFA